METAASPPVARAQTRCPGCGVDGSRAAGMPARFGPDDLSRFDATAACLTLRTALTERALADLRYGAAHQMAVDAYGAQHGHRGSGIATVFGLAGLFLAFERDLTGPQIRAAHQRMAGTRRAWPRLGRPPVSGQLTVADALEDPDHLAGVGAWARSVWQAWAPWHDEVAELTDATAWR